MIKRITGEQQFTDTIQQDTPVVVKFETTWCPDCKRLNMFIEEIIEEQHDLQWFKMDKDLFPEVAKKQQVTGIPSLLVYKNGDKIAHLHSAHAKTPDQVRAFLQETLGNGSMSQ